MWQFVPYYHWSVWIFILIGILFFFWLFFRSDHEHEYVGLEPILPYFYRERPGLEAGEEETEVELETQELTDTDICFTLPRLTDVPTSCEFHDTTKITHRESLILFEEGEGPQVPPPSNPSRWKRQERCCRSIEELIGQPFERDVRTIPWLYNPETGARLELDCYNKDLGIAIEHNGEHHYKYPNRWNKDYDDWLAMVRRDRLKPDLCDQNGVYLITIPYSIPYNEIKTEIKKQLQPLAKR